MFSRLSMCGATLALAAVAAFAVGCGETVIDDSKTEAAIKQDFVNAVKEKVDSVDCPSDVKVEAGKTFSCSVKLSDGKEQTVEMKILNEDADIKIVGINFGGSNK